MKAAYCTSNDNSNSCAFIPGTQNHKQEGGIISKNTNLISSSVDGCFDTCSFQHEASDAQIFAFCQSHGLDGSVAYDGEATGAIATTFGGECSGSVATSSGGSSFSGGGCFA